MPGKSQRPSPTTASGAAKDGSKTPEATSAQQLLSPDGKPLKQAEVQVAAAPQVELCGFRGVRTVNGDKVKDMAVDDPRKQDVERITASHYLLFAGHVGASVDNGSTVYGLTPAFPEGISPEQGIDHLYNHSMTFPGTAANDKPVFDMAESYHQEKGWNTTCTLRRGRSVRSSRPTICSSFKA